MIFKLFLLPRSNGARHTSRRNYLLAYHDVLLGAARRLRCLNRPAFATAITRCAGFGDAGVERMAGRDAQAS